MKHGIFPQYLSPKVMEAEQNIMSHVLGKDRINSFFRDYLSHSLSRIAMNYLFLKEMLDAESSLLDVGSLGIEAVLLKEQFPGGTFSALSYEGGRVGLRNKRFYETLDPEDSNCVFINKVDVEKEKIPFQDDSFDYVSCFEVIEHLKYSPVNMLKEINRVLKPTGKLVLSTPNINSSLAISKILCGQSPSEEPRYNRNPEYGIIHAKEYTISELELMLTDMGFQVNETFTFDDNQVTQQEIFIRKNIGSFKDKMGGKFSFFSKPSQIDLGHKIGVVASKKGMPRTDFPGALFQ